MPRHLMRTILLLALALPACREAAPDASGNFEATEVTLAAESAGRLLALTPREGDAVAAGAVVGVVDTIAVGLQRAEAEARLAAATARLPQLGAAVAALETQREVAQRELERTRRLLVAQAATSSQGDRAERDARVLADEARGARAARAAAEREVAALRAHVAQLDDRLARSRVTSPLTGTVLARYAEPGEYVQPGAPLLKVAALDTLVLRAYVDGATLPRVRIGAPVEVRADDGQGGLAAYAGRVEWVASSVEFTPTPIQTRDERTTQVYAVKVRVANPGGRLKIGMPGELVLPAAAR